MAENYYELYKLDPAQKQQRFMLRPYRYLMEHGFRARVDHYRCVLKEDLRSEEKPIEIRAALEGAGDRNEDHRINIGDVLAVTTKGITAAYFTDPEKLILVPDFFYVPADGSLIMIDTENSPLDGRKGSWMTVDSMMIDRRLYFLMQSLDYGRDAPYVIVDEQGREYAADPKGFTEDSIEQVRIAAAELVASRETRQIEKPISKPKLEVWQQYLENGEYLRAAEISEEENYNMIDGRANNRSARRSVLERLQEKQSEIKAGPALSRDLQHLQEEDIERSRK